MTDTNFRLEMYQYVPAFLYQATLVYGESTVLGTALFYTRIDSRDKQFTSNCLNLKNLDSWASKLILERFGYNCHPAIEIMPK